MRALKVIGAGAAAGLIGAAIWAGVAYATHREVGLVAWGIGALVGLGVRFAAREWEGAAPGAIAAGVALLAVVLGKYAAVSLVVGKELGNIDVLVTDDDMIGSIADDICREREKQGKRLAWPPGMSVENATKAEDYPPGVWAEAVKRWNALSPAEKVRQKEGRKQDLSRRLAADVGEVKKHVFWASFGPFDILWFGLAVVTAFRLGSGTFQPD